MGPPWSEATGQHTAAIVVRNGSASPCSLDGYPRLELRDSSGRVLAFRFSHAGDQMVTSARPRRVTVRGGGRAFFVLNKYRCDIRSSAAARFLRVLLPGSRQWLRLRLPRYPILDYCAAERVSLKVAVSPVVSALREAGAR